MAGDAQGWNAQTELAAQTVDLLQMLLSAWATDFEVIPTKRPKSLAGEPEPEEAIPASQIMSFLEGI
jgi:hypothetical protein